MVGKKLPEKDQPGPVWAVQKSGLASNWNSTTHLKNTRHSWDPPEFPHDLRHRGSDRGACEQKSCRVPAQSLVFACLDTGKAPPPIAQKGARV